MDNSEAYQRARERAQAKLAFRSHAAVYVGVCSMLVILNLLTSSDVYWFIWPVGGWGIGLFLHALATYVFGDQDRLTEEMIQRKLNTK